MDLNSDAFYLKDWKNPGYQLCKTIQHHLQQILNAILLCQHSKFNQDADPGGEEKTDSIPCSNELPDVVLCTPM